MSEINHSIWTYSHTNISVINIHHSFEYNDSQDTTRDGAWSIFLHLKKLASATALPSFMVREIRCQTYGRLPISTSTCWLSMFSSSLWDVVFVLDPQQRNPHMDSKHSTVYLITIQNVPVLVWIRDFFFFSSHWSTPGAYDLSMRLTALDQVGQPISVGITHQSGKQR